MISSTAYEKQTARPTAYDGDVCRLVRVRFRGRTLVLTIDCPNDPAAEWLGVIVSYKYSIEDDRDDRFVKASSALVRGGSTRLVCEIDADGFPFKRTHWNVSVACESGGALLSAGLHAGGKPSSLALRQFTARNYIFRPDGDVLCWRFDGTGALSLMLREKSAYDGRSTRVKEIIAAIVFALSSPALRRRRILLIHEKRCNRASDNAWYLFKHCMESGAERRYGRRIYYVIDKGAPDYAKMRHWDANVIDFMSLKHMVFLLAARSIASTESRPHDYAWQPTASLIGPLVNKRGKHIFLQHGVLAIKRLPGLFFANRLRSALVTCISEREARIVEDCLGFNPERVAITGYARFDALEDKAGNTREILLMPSLRTFLFWAGDRAFLDTAFYRVYSELLDSPDLERILTERDCTLNFFMHPSISGFAKHFAPTSGRIRLIADGEESLDALMMRCSMLVTDYSSIAWDVLYLKKPVLFFQYDLEQFLATSGSYIDLRTELPGDRTETVDGLLDLIASYAASGFALSGKYASMREDFFKFTDRENAQRVIDEICRRGL